MNHEPTKPDESRTQEARTLGTLCAEANVNRRERPQVQIGDAVRKAPRVPRRLVALQ